MRAFAARPAPGRTGRPFLLALAYAHPDEVDPASPGGLGYYFGRDIVVHPVTEPDQAEWPIWLPPGDWVDVWEPSQTLPGGSHVVDVRSITVPAFVRVQAAKKRLGM
ncbi:hypothetical protein [Limnochorda pilosa]|uniref:hypothetical protein n=1 Tax=Limnochorda pilosa TaxID=1555112 RepID=UPI0038B377E6